MKNLESGLNNNAIPVVRRLGSNRHIRTAVEARVSLSVYRSSFRCFSSLVVLVQRLKLTAWKVGDCDFVPRSGIEVFKETKCFFLWSLVKIHYCGGPP